MHTAKSLWAAVQGDPKFMRRVNGWLTIFWIAMIPISYSLGWLSSVVYVSALSLWALVSGHWSAWQAARVEVKQEDLAAAAEETDLPGEIVERIVEPTEVRPVLSGGVTAVAETTALSAASPSGASASGASASVASLSMCTCAVHGCAAAG